MGEDDYDSDDDGANAAPETPALEESGETTQNPRVRGEDVDHVAALKRYHRGWDRDRYNIERAYEDLNFLAGYQWIPELETQRLQDGRPVLTFNRMGQFVRQVTGDMRKMRPAIKIVPTHSGADEKIAEIREGLIRHIENASDAALDVYVDAADSQVAAGIGHWEVASQYNMLGQQELILRTLDDQVAVIWDPDSRKKTREDAMFCFVPVDLTREAYKDTYPNHSISDIGTWDGQQLDNWYDGDRIRVCRYWYKVQTTITMLRLPDGSIIDASEPPAGVDVETLMLAGAEPFEREGFEVYWRMMNCVEFLTEPKKWPGQYIPIVPAIGEEIKAGSRRERHGIVRFASDPQRAYNYARSTQTEFVGLQPKSPFVGTEENFRDYAEEWDTANVKNWPYLRYAPDPKNGSVAPQRQPPPSASSGLSECIADAAADMQAVVGIYNASLGAKSNETSGVAIQSREQQSDTGTYVYIANFALSITHTARIINDLIPHFYDTARTVRILGLDGKSKQVAINQPQTIDGISVTMENDITVGVYDIQMEMGPSFQTQREEARAGMSDFIKAFPPAAPLIADMIAKLQDWPQKDEIAERLEVLLPPPIKAQLDAKAGRPPQPPPPPDPVKLAEAQATIAESQSKTTNAQADAAKAQLEIERKRLELEQQKLQNMKAEIDLLAAQVRAGENGPPIDQAKLHEWVLNTDEAIKFLTEHTAAQIGMEGAHPQPQPQSQPTPAQAPTAGAPQPSAPQQEAMPAPAPETTQPHPIAGARRAPDGNFYVQHPTTGQFHKVEPVNV